MRRCGSGFFLTLAITFVVAFTGCLGKSTSNSGNGGVESVSLNPSSLITIDVGTTQVFSASGRDSLGHTVIGASIQFVVSVPAGVTGAAPLSIAGNGNACAGTWDASVTICSPGNPGIATVTAVIQGVSSPVTTVYVHQHVDSIQIVQANQSQPPYQYSCFPQGQTWQFQAIAYSHNVDITNSVGPMNWSSSNFGVVATAPMVQGQPPNEQFNLVQTTAKIPGITQIFANVSGVTSSPYAYSTCLIKAIYLQIGGQGQAGNSITVNTGGSVPITATAIDTLNNIFDFAPLANPPLTWSTTNPEVAGFSTVSSASGSNNATTRANLGGASLSASCGPPTCNIGVLPSLPVYSSDGTLPNGEKGYGTISVNVTSTANPRTYTAWAATTQCEDALGCSSAMFAVTPNTTGVNPIGAILSLPRTPNSMMFNHVATARAYLGSDQGLMYVDVSANNPSATLVSSSSTPCSTSLCGKVLTISNDGKLVVVSDTVSTPHHVYIYNGSNTSTAPVDIILGNQTSPGEFATAAAFSPDQLKLFITTNAGNMYVYSTVDAFTRVPSPVSPASGPTFATPPNAVISSMDGSFAYVAVSPALPPAASVPGFVSGFANCDTPSSEVLSAVPLGTPSISSNPLALYPLPTLQTDQVGNPTEVVLALDTPIPPPPPPPPAVPPPAPPTTIDTFGVNAEQNPLPYNQFVCELPTVKLYPNFPQTSANLGQGNFTPLYTQLVADGTKVIIVGQAIPSVLIFDVNSGSTTSIPLFRPLFGTSLPLAASATTDGSQVFVAACDQYPNNDPTKPCAAGSIHIVNTVSQGDFLQVPYLNPNTNALSMCSSQGGTAPLCLSNLVAIRPQ